MINRLHMALMSHLKKHWRPWLILAVALVVQLIFFGLLLRASAVRNADLFILGGGDEMSYMRPVQGILCCGVFSYSENPPFTPDSVRTPGYPLLLTVGHLLTGGRWVWVMLLQCLLLSVTPVLLYYTSRRFGERVALVSGLVFALEPVRAIWSSVLMSDAMFTFLAILSIYWFFKWADHQNWRYAVFIGACLGLATMVRPIGMYLWLAFLLAMAVQLGFKKWKTLLVHSAIVLLSFGVFVLPWMWRNQTVFGRFDLSVIPSYSLAYANANQYLHAKTGKPLSELNADLEKLMPVENPEHWPSLTMVPIFQKYFRDAVGQDYFGYAKFHLIKTIPYFVNDGLRLPATIVGLISSDAPAPNLSDFFLQGRFMEKFSAFASSQPLAVSLLVVGSLFWCLVWLAALIGWWFMWRKPEYRPWCVLVFLYVGYFVAASSGPVANARYRLPIEGLLFLLAVYAFLSRSDKRLSA